jgi:ribosomal protein S18 acetylase RimI-like enzyme
MTGKKRLDMTSYTLRDGNTVEVEYYQDSHAGSIATGLFQGVTVQTVVQQRQTLLAPGPEEVCSVCCLSGKEVVGICTGVRKRWSGERHRIEMVQVVVREDARGLGIAKHMMQEVAAHFKPYGVEIVQISAEASNEQAYVAYQKIGFETIGVFRRGLKYDDKYSDEILLSMAVLDLMASDKQ